ncbi:metal ABC transporter ATP-binding protein [Raineyella sp. W15-4]|uniref:metal ABC transporter ATP-binding protein n=1 Tax=Raineyella sp. W15-4 TaxID=3081651 RepID=UPI002955BB7E|nr:ATP-binding cassette domain-containing protein [Raineyella sp. W15-4]WOQ18964.1 ATP-binding cassette domain-containing protein [Raineyella sp. W15-4]
MTRATLTLGERTLWRDLDLQVRPGEFIAVLGSNGSGKTSLLRTILGEHRLAAGSGEFLGQPLRRGDSRIGYVPQQHLADAATMLRGRDLVGLGLTGHQWGIDLPSRRRRARIDTLLAEVGASGYAEAPVGLLSGGEQQRLRIAQALAGEPLLMLCDEPLASLDLRAQAEIVDLIDDQRRARGFAVLVVTHDINPVLGVVDRVLYLGNGRFRIGTPDEVLRSEVLTGLYDSPVEVIRAGGRILVAGMPEQSHHPEQR